MNSDSKSFLFAFLFFIAFGLVELINQGVFIFPIFMVAPVGFGVLGYVLIKAKERISVFNVMALLSMLLITLISGFIPMLTTQVPAYLQNETFVSAVAIGIGACWVVAYLFFSISVYQNNNNNIVYILLLLLSFAGWIFFDWKGNLVMQGILIFVHILLLFLIKGKYKEETQLRIFCNTVLFYNGLEFLYAYGTHFI